MLKRVVSLMLLFCLLFGQKQSVLASENELNVSDMTEEEMDERLMSQGATESFLAKIPMSEKRKLLEYGVGRFETKSETYIIQEPSSDALGVGRGTISEKELTLEMTMVDYFFGTSSAILFYYATYEWNDMPLWRLTDYISVEWEDDVLQPTDDSSALVDRITFGDKEIDTVYHYETYGTSSDATIWTIDIRNEGECEMKSGYAVMSFVPRPGVDHYSISTLFEVNYAHITLVPTVGITLGDGKGISLSMAKNVYNRGIRKTFKPKIGEIFSNGAFLRKTL